MISNTVIGQINTASTFSGWLDNTNKCADALTSVVLTSDAGAYAGANSVPTTGNVSHNGSMSVKNLTSNTISGSNGSLTFVATDVIFDSSSSLNVAGPLTSNGAVAVGNTLSVTKTFTANDVVVGGNASLSGVLSVATNGTATVGNTTSSANVFVYGNIWATGNIEGYQTSDERFKDNVLPIDEQVLDGFLHSVPAVSFVWNNGSADEGTLDIGVIAQHVAKVYPRMVREDSDGYLSVNYSKLIPILLGIVQRQQKQIDKLQKAVSNDPR